MIADVASCWRALASGQGSSLGASFKPGLFRGSYQISVLKVAPASPLAVLGVEVGDVIEFDRYQDSRRRFAQGEHVGLTVRHAGQSRHLVAVPTAVPLGTAYYWNYWCGLLMSAIALFFGMLVIFNRPESTACRALAL